MPSRWTRPSMMMIFAEAPLHALRDRDARFASIYGFSFTLAAHLHYSTCHASAKHGFTSAADIIYAIISRRRCRPGFADVDAGRRALLILRRRAAKKLQIAHHSGRSKTAHFHQPFTPADASPASAALAVTCYGDAMPPRTTTTARPREISPQDIDGAARQLLRYRRNRQIPSQRRRLRYCRPSARLAHSMTRLTRHYWPQ